MIPPGVSSVEFPLTLIHGVIAITIVQLVYIPRLFEENWTLRAWPYFLCIQFVQFVSILAACIVYFLPFLRSLQSGLPWATTTAFSLSYNLSGLSKPIIKGSAQPDVDGQASRITDRRVYVKITTENQVVSRKEPGTGATTRFESRSLFVELARLLSLHSHQVSIV